MVAAYPERHRIMSDVVELQGKGWRLKDIAKLPGMPCQPTLWRWQQATPIWEHQLKQARREVAFQRRQARVAARWAFDPAKAAAFVYEVRRGRRIAELTRQAEWPSKALLTRWRRERPEFGAALDAAIAAARRTRPRVRWRYDEKVCDRAMLKLIRGATLADLSMDATVPGPAALRRWRREVEGLDGAVRMAMQAGERVRVRARSKCTPQMIERIEMAIVEGASLWDLGKREDFPCEATLYRWLRKRPEFAAAVDRASRFRDELLLDAQLEIVQRTRGRRVAKAQRQLGAIHQRLSRMRKRGRWAHEPPEGRPHPDSSSWE